jgi:hypothetical protein
MKVCRVCGVELSNGNSYTKTGVRKPQGQHCQSCVTEVMTTEKKDRIQDYGKLGALIEKKTGLRKKSVVSAFITSFVIVAIATRALQDSLVGGDVVLIFTVGVPVLTFLLSTFFYTLFPSMDFSGATNEIFWVEMEIEDLHEQRRKSRA